MLYDFLKHPDYIVARNNEDYFYFGKIPVPVLKWEEILMEFNREYILQLNIPNEKIVASLEDYGFCLHKPNYIPSVRNFLKEICNSHSPNYTKTQVYSAHMFLSFTSISKTYGKHKDTQDVWCWQLAGETLWQVEGKTNNFEKIMRPGDLIYVPRRMWHDTKPITPRATLSFGSEDHMKTYALSWR